jgi:ATP-binding cassette subfamily C (CFTR/MRP) protein 4
MDYYTPHQQNITQKQAWIYAFGLILLSLVRVVFYRWFLMQLSVFGMKVRIACSSLIYRKSLQLQKNDLEKITTGQIVNLLSNDVNKFDRAFMFLHFLWIGPIELMAVTWYMVVTFGYTAIIGITMIILSVFLQSE